MPRAAIALLGQTGLVHCETHHWWFGFAHYSGDPADHPMVGKLGPNALDLSLDEFRALLSGRRGAIKTFLLNQDRIAGIGNVHIQDPLWKARIHPLRPIHTLSDGEIEALWQALRQTLQDSIAQGGFAYEQNLPAGGKKGSWNCFEVGYREGHPCPRCGTVAQKIKTGSTASYICPRCQPLEPRNRPGYRLHVSAWLGSLTRALALPVAPWPRPGRGRQTPP